MKKQVDTPVMMTFISDNHYYLYDPFSNCIFTIKKEHYIELAKLNTMGLTAYKKNVNSSSAHKDILHLIQRGFLKANIIERIIHPLEKDITSLCSRSINDISLQVTKDCNFSCRYCLFAADNSIERNHNKVFMPWEIAKESIDFLFAHSKDADTINISFYGGEPLINFPLIVKVVQYAEKRFYSKTLNYIMTTNGSMLSPTIIDFLAKYNFSVAISLDLKKDLHDFHRKMFKNGKNTFDEVYKKVLMIRENHPRYFNDRVSFIPVLFPDEEYDYESSVFQTLSVRKENIHPTDVNMQGIDYLLRRGAKKISIKQNGEEEKRLMKILKNKNALSQTWYPSGQCVPGVKRIFIDTEGVFYPCEKVIEASDLSIGNIKTGINVAAIKDILNCANIIEGDCRVCWALRFCSMCVSDCYDIENGVNCEKKRIVCNAYKKNISLFLKEYVQKHTERLGYQ